MKATLNQLSSSRTRSDAHRDQQDTIGGMMGLQREYADHADYAHWWIEKSYDFG